MNGGSQAPGHIGTVLNAGDLIQTHQGAMAGLELSDGSTLELGEMTKLDLAKLVKDSSSGARVSRIMLLWGKVRSLLSPGHQVSGSSFTYETANAVAGVKFSQPDSAVLYDPDREVTMFAAHHFGAKLTNISTEESLEISEGEIGIVQRDLIYSMLLTPIVHFETDRVYLTRFERTQLDTFAIFLQGFPQRHIILEGHADSTGGEARNEDLAQRRAENVRYYLVTRHDIDEKRFTIYSYGSKQPIDTNDTEEGRAKNRRVMISTSREEQALSF